MSQVLFRCPRINHQVVLPFKDSKSEAAEPSRCHAERGLAGSMPMNFILQPFAKHFIGSARA